MNESTKKNIEMVIWAVIMLGLSYRMSLISLEGNPFFIIMSILSGIAGFVLVVSYLFKRFG